MVQKWLILLLLICLTACEGLKLPLFPPTPVISPSPLPGIISPTPPYSSTNSPSYTLTLTPTSTFTTSPSPTLGPLGLDLIGCNTSLDINHGLGEVTNAFPLIQNRTGEDLTNVCATLSASDEAKLHPDKTACTPALPAGYQVTLKLTVDTGFRQDTSIKVDVSTDQGVTTFASKPSCRNVGLPGWVPGKVGLVEPLP